MSEYNPGDRKEKSYFRIASSVWIISLIIISFMVFEAPLKRTVTPVYHAAVEKWWSLEPLYSSGNYYYFPQFVLIFAPFHLLPAPLGDVLWRVISAGLFVWGLWRLVSLSNFQNKAQLLFYASLIAITPALGAIRNGQANVMIAALFLHATASLAKSQWWIATICLIGSVFIKPIGLIMLVLGAAIYRKLVWRGAVGFFIFLILPFFLSNRTYVISLYQESLRHLFLLSLITEHRFADLNGLLRTLGVGLTGTSSQIVRLGAGLFTFVIWWRGSKRVGEPQRAWLCLALSTSYLMLFNPMTEGNSYVIVAPIMALFAVCFVQTRKYRGLGYCLIFMDISIGVLPEMVRTLSANFGLWWRPTMTLFFSGLLIYMVFSRAFRWDSLVKS